MYYCAFVLNSSTILPFSFQKIEDFLNSCINQAYLISKV